MTTRQPQPLRIGDVRPGGLWPSGANCHAVTLLAGDSIVGDARVTDAGLARLQTAVDGAAAVEAMTADRDWLRGLWEAEVAAITAVRQLHSPDHRIADLCTVCSLPYPCRTIRTLDQHASEPGRVNPGGAPC